MYACFPSPLLSLSPLSSLPLFPSFPFPVGKVGEDKNPKRGILMIWVRHSGGPHFRRSAILGYYCYNNPNPNPNPRIPGMADLRNGGPLPRERPLHTSSSYVLQGVLGMCCRVFWRSSWWTKYRYTSQQSTRYKCSPTITAHRKVSVIGRSQVLCEVCCFYGCLMTVLNSSIVSQWHGCTLYCR